jgi:ribosomal protein L40E
MRFEHSKTGMWAVLAGVCLWVPGFVLYFVLGGGALNDSAGHAGMILLIAGLLLILSGGQIIRVAMRGETIQPVSEGAKVRLLVCPRCGMDNPEEARYCLGCGRKIKQPWPREGEKGGEP